MSSRPRETPWIVCFDPKPALRLRLFCFAYAGGNANIFRGWAAKLPYDVEVVGVQYPGRGEHVATPVTDWRALVAELDSAIKPWLDQDCVFFGHSNGALISFELARRLRGEARSRLRHQLFSAREAPQSLRRRKISRLPRNDLIRSLRDMEGTPEEILNDAPLMDLILPRLRADFRLSEDYQFETGPRAPCAATVLYGSRDVNVAEEGLAEWRDAVEGEVDFVRIEDGHFFVHTSEAAVLSVVFARVTTELAALNSS